MPLAKTTNVYGYATVLDREPRIEAHEDVLYVPFGMPGISPGIYDRGRRLITAAGFYRGVPNVHLVHESAFSTMDPDTVPVIDMGAPLVFVNCFVAHYGHFLLSSLSRYWWVPFARDTSMKMLHLHHHSADQFFELAYVRDTIAQLGLQSTDFTGFAGPVRLPRLTIPAPSFEENNIAYRIFARLCNRIGALLMGKATTGRTGAPVFLSKKRLGSGVNTIVNEDEFCDELERHGVEIVYPEMLSLADQIRLFHNRPVVTGTSGSALHTGIFSPRNRLLILNHTDAVWSNQLLLDGANLNDSAYFYPEGEIENLGGSSNFGNNFKLREPRRLASEFLREIDNYLSKRRLDGDSPPERNC